MNSLACLTKQTNKQKNIILKQTRVVNTGLDGLVKGEPVLGLNVPVLGVHLLCQLVCHVVVVTTEVGKIITGFEVQFG